MITAPATPASRRAIPGFHGRQPSSDGRFAGRRECDGQAGTASLHQIALSRASQALQVSCERSNFDRNDAHGCAGPTVDEVTANLPALAYSPVLSLPLAARVVALGAAVGIGRDNTVGHRAGKLFGEEGFDVHGGNSDPIATNIGPLALHVKDIFRRSAA